MARNTSVIGYLASGGIAAAANYGSRFVFSLWLPFEAAVVAAYLVGMVTAFLLMRRFAFTDSQKTVGRMGLTWGAEPIKIPFQEKVR